MFFIVSKLLAFLISPLTWILVLLLIAIFSKNAKRKKKTLVAAVIMLFLFSNTFIFDEAMRLWEAPAKKNADLNTVYDAGIVLGGIVVFDEAKDKIQFNRRNDRLMQAVLLYRKGIIRKIFFTSGSGSIQYPEIKEAPLAKKFLTDIGIPEQDILIESESNNTHENAAYSKPILEKNFPEKKFLLITSGFHMRRSIGCFKKVGIEVTPFSTDRYSGPRKFIFDHVFIPESGTLFNWDSLLHEMVGYLTYCLFGYI